MINSGETPVITPPETSAAQEAIQLPIKTKKKK
jgi:hypothetical protein